MHKNVKNGSDYKRAIGDYNDDINNDVDNTIDNNENNNDNDINDNNNNNNNNSIYTLRNAYNSNDTIISSWSPQTVNFRSAFLEVLYIIIIIIIIIIIYNVIIIYNIIINIFSHQTKKLQNFQNILTTAGVDI